MNLVFGSRVWWISVATFTRMWTMYGCLCGWRWHMLVLMATRWWIATITVIATGFPCWTMGWFLNELFNIAVFFCLDLFGWCSFFLSQKFGIPFMFSFDFSSFALGLIFIWILLLIVQIFPCLIFFNWIYIVHSFIYLISVSFCGFLIQFVQFGYIL